MAEEKETPVVVRAAPLAIKAFEDGTPSNWTIEATDKEGVINARSNQTGETFSGALADFNKLLRG